MPGMNYPNIRFPVLECDKVIKEVDNGGCNVHPAPPPNSEVKERTRKRTLKQSGERWGDIKRTLRERQESP